MLANYGYMDAEGAYYISIDTAKCSACVGKPCVASCPRSVFALEEDPYGERVVAVTDGARRKIKYECSPCKPSKNRQPLSCVEACPFGAISHSW